MSEVKSSVECTCSVCGKAHVRELLYDIDELNETQMALIKKSVCYECRTRRNELLSARIHSRLG